MSYHKMFNVVAVSHRPLGLLANTDKTGKLSQEWLEIVRVSPVSVTWRQRWKVSAISSL